MNVTQKIKMDLLHKQNTVIIDVMQGDGNARTIEFSLYSGGIPWNVPDGVSVAVAYLRPDGAKGIYDTIADGSSAVSVSGNSVSAVIVPQAVSVDGDTKLTVVLTNDAGEQLATFGVVLRVEYNPAIGAVEPEDYINLRQVLIEMVEKAMGETGALPDFVVDVFGGEAGYFSDESFLDIQYAYNSGRTIRCRFDTGEQGFVKLPLVKDHPGKFYFSAVCEGVEYLVTISEDEAGETAVTVTQRTVGEGSGGSGKDGGYYLPTVKQAAPGTMTMSFSPSKSDMPAVPPVALVLPQGEKGDTGATGEAGKDGQDGSPGKDGTSPVVSVSEITGGHRISITDINGTKTVDVMDGVDGQDGENATAATVLCGKKIVYDGDSICESRTGSTANNGGGYAKIIADMVGGTYENKAVSGAALTSTPSDKTYHSVVDSLSELPTDGDLYCFEGGYNDFCRDVEIGNCDDADYTGDVDTSTICGAMERIFRYCLSILIGRPVCFVIVHKCQSAGHAANGTGKTFKDYRDAMIQVCEKYSIPYYDAFTKSGLNGWNKAQSNTYLTANINGTGDGTHPNEQGYKRYYVPQLIALFESMMPTDVVQSEPGEESEPIVNLIDSVGYEDGYRLSTSAGTTKALAGYTTSGYIHATTSGDVYRTQGVNFNADDNAQCIFVAYSADKTFETGIYLKNSTSPNATTGFSIETDADGNLTITVTQNTERYFRISGYGYGANLIVTKNQAIE